MVAPANCIYTDSKTSPARGRARQHPCCRFATHRGSPKTSETAALDRSDGDWRRCGSGPRPRSGVAGKCTVPISRWRPVSRRGCALQRDATQRSRWKTRWRFWKRRWADRVHQHEQRHLPPPRRSRSSAHKRGWPSSCHSIRRSASCHFGPTGSRKGGGCGPHRLLVQLVWSCPWTTNDAHQAHKRREHRPGSVRWATGIQLCSVVRSTRPAFYRPSSQRLP